MNKCRIAIIDDGAIGNVIQPEKNLVVNEQLEIYEDNDIAEEAGHAFVCLSIIKKYSKCDDFSWLNIKVIDTITGRSSSDQLIKALEYCLNNDVSVIHMSIGSEEFCDFEKIDRIVKKLLDKGVIMVASQSNEGKMTYPACIEGVIGVKYADGIKDDEFIFVDQAIDNIDFITSPSHILKNGNGFFISRQANSYATPVMTAHVINELMYVPNISAAEVFEKLKAKAVDKISGDVLLNNQLYSDNTIQIPVVGVFDSNVEKAEKIAHELSVMFNNDGYGAVYSIPHGNGMNRYHKKQQKKYYSFLELYSSCNIIIAGSDKDISDEIYCNYDIIVTDDELKFKDLSEKIIPLQDRTSTELYKLILKEFE